MYKCKACGRRFDSGVRRDNSQVITDYVDGKQTIEQLASKYDVNERTIRRDLEGMRQVYKIGLTSTSVESRIANAKNEATYLCANVEIAAT